MAHITQLTQIIDDIIISEFIPLKMKNLRLNIKKIPTYVSSSSCEGNLLIL